MKNLTRIIASTAGMGLLIPIAACGSESAGSGANSITFASYGGETQEYQDETLAVPFTEETGIEVEHASPSSIGKLRPQVESGNVTWDVTSMGADNVAKYCGEYFEELPEDLIDEEEVYGDMADAYSSDCGVAHYTAPSIMLYNTEQFGEDAPATIADAFDTEKFPGKRIFLPNVNTGILEIALLADGVAVDDLYPLDVDRAFEKLDTVKDDAIFPDTYGELQQAYASGSVAVGFATPSRAAYVIEDGAPYEPVWDKTVSMAEHFAIVKGSPNIQGAQQFLQFTAQAEPQAAEATKTGLPPVNPNAEPDYSDVQKELDVNAPEASESIVPVDVDWWAEHTDEALERYTAWKAG